MEGFLAKPLSEEGAGSGLVVAADADGAEECEVAGVTADERADGAPEEVEGLEGALVVGVNEGAAEFEGGAEVVPERGVEAEEGLGVEVAGGVVGGAEAVGAGDLGEAGVPEDEVVVVVVEGVEVGGEAGAFAGGAESDFAEAADFANGEGGEGMIELPDLPGPLLGEQAFRREVDDFGGNPIGRDGGGDGVALRGGGWDGGALSKPVDAGAEFGGGADGVGVEAGGGDGVADTGFDPAASFVPEFAGQEGGAEAGVDEAGDLEEGAVLAGEEKRDGGGAGFADETGGGGVPGGVLDADAAEVEVGDLTGGEDDEESTVLEPGEGGAEAAGVGEAGGRVGEGVDEDEAVAHLGDGAEDGVGEELDVRAYATEESGGGDSVDEAEGVVGDDDGGAGARDAVEVGAVDVEMDVEPGEEEFREGGGGGLRGGGGVEGIHLIEVKEAVEGSGDGSGETGGREPAESAGEQMGGGHVSMTVRSGCHVRFTAQ